MKTHPLPSTPRATAFGRLLLAAFGVWLVGSVYAPPVMAGGAGMGGGASASSSTTSTASSSAVAVSQSPLTLQPAIPPNITLMIDDSGSMMWDFMPDACYLQGVVCTGTSNGASSPSGGTDTISSAVNDAVIDAANNGVYYNPKITYTPPPTASGGSYTSYTDMTNVPSDGFNTGNGCFVGSLQRPSSNPGNCDLTNHTTSDLTGENLGATKKLYYSASNTAQVPTPYSQAVSATYSQQCVSGKPSKGQSGCNYNSGGSNSGHYVSVLVTGADAVCTATFNSDSGTAGTLVFTLLTTDPTSGQPATGTCQFSSLVTQTFNFFQYSTGPAAGPYTVYYVAVNASSCSYHPTPSPSTDTYGGCVGASDTTGTAAPATDAKGNALAAGTNIANWFAYYHTRIQMAKSGLMTAFSTMDKGFRVGFGSIDGGANGDSNALPSPQYTYADNSNYIAEVQPFGDGVTGVTSTNPDQKTNFWNWAAALSPGGGTPLREALDNVGQYYQSSQPWTTMSSDPGYGTPSQPSNIACRQSYTILTTDGFWNGNGSGITSATLRASDNNGTTVTGPNNQTYTYAAAAPYSGGDTNDGTPSLADVAMYYWETDLQGNIANEVPTNTADPAFWQHMTTFTMGLGFQPQGITGTAPLPSSHTPPATADIANWMNDGGSSTSKYAISSFAWPTSPNGPASNSAYNISDLEHAGVNGHGGFFSAIDPNSFTSGIQQALDRAAKRVGTGASLAANSTQLTNGSVAYQATYYSAVWTGDLSELPINSSTGVIGNAKWTASTMLPSAANRTIVTYNPTGTTSATKFPAFVNGSTAAPTLTSAELNALGSSTTAQMAMVNYLRGDGTQGSSYRSRSTPLGDIVDSQPVYSGELNANEFEGQTFTGITDTNAATGCDNSFQAFTGGDEGSTTTTACVDATSRTPLVFVAGNDGMLHAFNAGTGTEVYAYLPGAVLTGDVGVNASGTTSSSFDNTALATLANLNYGSSTGSTPHQFYNDGELTIADIFDGSNWRTVLVGTTGRGPAKAVYALDITSATVNSSGTLSGITPLWERSALDGQTNSGYIGQMVGKPVIAKVQDGSTSDWQVLMGNGYNSSNGKAALLEFDVLTGTLSVHTTSNRTGLTSGNGLAAPVAWMDSPSTGVADVAYAGDLQGQVWRFTLSTSKTTGNGTTYTTSPASLGGVDSSTAFDVFNTPLDASNNPQPITAGMLAGSDPTTSNVWLFFGTGQYLSSSDTTNMQVESWYGVIAQPGGSFMTGSALTQSNLVQRSITYEQDANATTTPPTLGIRTVTTNNDSNGGAIPSGDYGWYLNWQAPTGAGGTLVNQGERMVTPNQFQGNLLLGTTRIPIVSDICNPSGSGWVMSVNPFTGTNPTTPFYQVNGGTTVTITIKVNGKTVTETVSAAGVGFTALPNNPIFVGSDMLMSFDNGKTGNVNTTGSTGGISRVSWQEWVNP